MTRQSGRDGTRPRVYLGWSADEIMATNVAETSLRSSSGHSHPDIHRISRLSIYRHYWRPTIIKDGQAWDVISDAPMSTDHALARFWIPFLCDYRGWALFTDGDVLFRRDVSQLFKFADERYAVMCVQHGVAAADQHGRKKDGDQQQPYHRKNWSSVMLWNCGHPANRTLSTVYLNEQRGLKLHQFCWLADAEIGPLPVEWNYLVNVTPECVQDPAIVHYTLGTPDLPGHEHDLFAEEWRAAARIAGYRLPTPAPLSVESRG